MDIDKLKIRLYGSLRVINHIGEDKVVDEIVELFQSQQQRIDELEKEKDLKRLYRWIMTDNREPSKTYFTSGELRNVANEFDFLFDKISKLKQQLKEKEEEKYRMWEVVCGYESKYTHKAFHQENHFAKRTLPIWENLKKELKQLLTKTDN